MAYGFCLLFPEVLFLLQYPCYQLIWIMAYLINLVPVFIVIRMRGFHLIDLRI